MTQELKHSALPWRTGNNVKSIVFMGDELLCPSAQCLNKDEDEALNEANAGLIVRCVNSHTALVKSLEETLAFAKRVCKHAIEDPELYPDFIKEAEEALKLAKQEQPLT